MKKVSEYTHHILMKLLSTKFITTTAIMVTACVFLREKAITAQIWADLMKTVLLIYASSNVAHEWVKAKNDTSE